MDIENTRGEALEQTTLKAGFPFGAAVFFVVFTFLNLPYQIRFFGAIRPTVIATILFFILIVANGEIMKGRFSLQSAKWLGAMVLWIALTIPLVRYPGSIIHKNFETFAKWALFFPLIIAFVDSERRLRIFVYAFVICEVIRGLDPLYLHYAHGYWGSRAYWNSSGHFMLRLSGAPWDIEGPNGLAEVCAIGFLFLHNWSWCRGGTTRRKWVYVILAPLLVWTIILTGSRSGLLALLFNVMLIIWYSKRRTLGIVVICLAAVLTVPHLSPIQRDRFLSIVDSHTKNASTAAGRIQGLEQNIQLWARRPIFGYGLGTSLEASFNYQDQTHMAHDIYTQTLIEIGLGGFILMIGYMISVYKTAFRMLKAMRNYTAALPDGHILLWLPRTLLIWAGMNFFFDLASYGLSSPSWYFMGGLTAVCARLLEARISSASSSNTLHSVNKPIVDKIERIHRRRPLLAIFD